MSKWLFLLLLLPFSAQAEGRKTLDFDLPCGSKKVTVQYQSSDDLHVRLHRPEKCSGGSSDSFHVELGLRTGFHTTDGNVEAVLLPSVGLSWKITDSWFLHADAGAGITSHGTTSDLSLGFGFWATDQLRFILAGGQVVDRTSSWLWKTGGPGGKLTVDYMLGPKAFLGLDVFAGPAWDKDNKLSGSFMSLLGLGWRF